MNNGKGNNKRKSSSNKPSFGPKKKTSSVGSKFKKDEKSAFKGKSTFKGKTESKGKPDFDKDPKFDTLSQSNTLKKQIQTRFVLTNIFLIQGFVPVVMQIFTFNLETF